MLQNDIEKNESFFQKVYRVLIIEKRLPISFERRYQKLLYEKKLQRALRKIASDTPIACAAIAKTELHMLTCERDFLMAIAACKSFLRFYPNVLVVFHGDDSLTDSMCEYLKLAIPSSRCIKYHEANDMIKSEAKIFNLRKKVSGRFELPEGYEKQRRAWALKVFDFHALSSAEKIIVMDSDVLFTKKPDEIIEWIEGDESAAFYSIPQFPNLKADSEKFRSMFPSEIPIDSFNGGLYGYNKKELSLNLLSDVVEKLILEQDYPVIGDECFWRVVFSIIPSSPLPFEYYPLITNYYQDNSLMPELEKSKYIHFICKHRNGLYGKIAESIF